MSKVFQQGRGLRTTGVLALSLMFSIATFAQTQSAASSTVPRLVQYSGIVKDASGKVLTGTVGVTFALYAAEQGGVPLWLETQNVQADSQGRYSIYLGATKPNGLPQDLFVSGEARWLGVQPQGEAEQPRTQLLSVPYAMKAGDAQTVGGLPASAFLLAPVAGASTSTSTSPGTTSPSSIAPPLAGSGTVNFVPLWTPDGNTLGNSVLFQSGTGTTAKIGVNTNAPATTLDVKGAGTIRGTLSLPSTGSATSTAGKNSQPLTWAASAFNSGTSAAVSQTFRWQTEPVNNNTTTPSGKFNLLFNSGSSSPVETGLSIASNGQITFATGQTFPGTGNGTITGVTAGTDLTGGGSTGNVTLNLDTSKVAQLGSNLFTGDQNVTGNVTASAALTGSVVNTTGSYEIGGAAFAFGSSLFANAFLGFAGNSTTTGGYLTALGYQALHSATSGSYNTALGYQALYSNDTGASNTASGWSALFANTSGSLNTATGVSALESNQTGWNNTGTGEQALFSNTTGQNNTATGTIALNKNATGNDNTAEGFAALFYNTGNQNTASGSGAGQFNTTGSDNTSIGFNSGVTSNLANTTGSNDTFLGANSGTLTNTALSNATAIGANAAVTASNAMVLGSINGINGATADTSVGIGTTAPAAKLDVHGTANFTGLITFAAGQTFPGAGTISGVTAGTDLTGGGSTGSVTLNVDTTKVVTSVLAGADLTGGGAGGVQTLNLDTSKVPLLAAANNFTANQGITGNLTASGTVTGAVVAASNTYNLGSSVFAFGSNFNSDAFLGFAGNTGSIGVHNTAVGANALLLVSSGAQNTAMGSAALLTNTVGSRNTAVGYSTANGNGTNTDNTAIGWNALSGNFTGTNNTADGSQALDGNSAGSFNTGVGMLTLHNNGNGNNNSALGYKAGTDVLFSNLNNTTAIGAFADVGQSNSVVLGSINGVNGATADTNVGIGTTTPVARLHIGVVNDSTIGLRVEGPSKSGTGASAVSLGGFGDFDVDAVGIPGGRLMVKENGRVGVAFPLFSVPTNIFQIGQSRGHALADGWDVYSSRRWKTNIHTLDTALDKVQRLRGVSYDLKASGKHEIGVIAEEVGQVVPEVVSYEDNGKDARGVDYSRLTALLIEAVKQQQQQIRSQQKQISLQQKQIRILRAKETSLATRLSTVEKTRAEANTPKIARLQAQPEQRLP